MVHNVFGHIVEGHIIKISEKWRCIRWKTTNFSCSTPVRRLLCSKPPGKFAQPQTSYAQKVHFCRWQLRHMFIQSRDSLGNRTLRWIWHSGSFKVILIGVSKNLKRFVVVMYSNMDLISKTYEDIASGKLQITSVWWQFSNKRFQVSNI